MDGMRRIDVRVHRGFSACEIRWLCSGPAKMSSMTSRLRATRRTDERRRLVQTIGRDVSRFQDASYGFDEVAAEILALPRSDLPCMTMLLFGGPGSADELSTALHTPRAVVGGTLERLQLAGYARFQPGGSPRLELTEHARRWIERIWAPLQREGNRLLDRYPTPL